MEEERETRKALLLGVGLDGDGHLRITRGPNFRLYGGSAETHELMQEKALAFNQALRDRKKSLEEIGRKEFLEIVEEIGFKPTNE